MTILNNIKNKQLIARKNNNKFLSSILTTLISEIEIIGKNNGNRNTTDNETIQVISKFRKNINDTLLLVTDSTQQELLLKEIIIYEKFLPSELSEKELTNIIKDIISHDSNSNIGKIMGFLKKQYNGQFDGKIASSIIKTLLN